MIVQPESGGQASQTRGRYVWVLFLLVLIVACSPELKNRLWPGIKLSSGSQEPVTQETGLMAVTSAIEALREPGDAILVRGSRLVSGLPFMPNNFQPALSGEYLIANRNQDGDLEHYPVTVWYCQEPVMLDGRFVTGGCPQTGASTLHSMQDENWQVQVLGYRDYLVFISVPSGSTWPCIFIGQLASRIAYFRTYAPLITDLSLPAVLRAGN